MTEKELKGRHVALMFVAGFGIIIGVNLFLAVSAVRTFPGLEVKNSYVASQSFDADRAAQEALGWTVEASVAGDVLTLSIIDAAGPVKPVIMKALLGRATHVGADRPLDLTFDGQTHKAHVPGLPSGNWNLRLEAKAPNGTVFKQRVIVGGVR